MNKLTRFVVVVSLGNNSVTVGAWAGVVSCISRSVTFAVNAQFFFGGITFAPLSPADKSGFLGLMGSNDFFSVICLKIYDTSFMNHKL